MKTVSPANKTDHFETVEDFVKQAEEITGVPTHSSRTTGRNDFYGTSTFHEAVSLTRTGWPEGAAKVLAIRSIANGIVNAVVNARATSYAYDVTGSFVDVGRFMSGEPECFFTESQECGNINNPIVKIIANLSASASVSSEHLFLRGASVAAAVDILESLGRRVEVYAASSHIRNKNIYDIMVMVKKANQPLDIDRLALAIAHPSFYRRLMFSLMEQNGHEPCATYVNMKGIKCDDAIITSPIQSSKGITMNQVLEFVADVCRKAGIEIPDEEIKGLAFQAGGASIKF